MTDMERYIEEYGVDPPVFEAYETAAEYQAAYDAWFDGFAAFIIRKTEEEEAARIAEEEVRRQAEEEEAVQQVREEEEAKVSQIVQVPEVEDRYPVGSYVDAGGRVWAASGELLSLDDGELFSPGTTPAMESVQEMVGEVTGEPVIDTALLLLDLLDILAGEEGMTDDVDGIQQTVNDIQQALDHPFMTTSFHDYNVTEGLLLLLLISVFMAACAKMLKEGFSWLR